MTADIGLAHPRLRPPNGNLVTASRWEGIFRSLGLRTERWPEWPGDEVRALVCIHAAKTHASVAAFRNTFADRPLIVAASGTDLYGPYRDTPDTLDSFRRADRIVVLQPDAVDALPADVRPRAVVILQSMAPRERGVPNPDAFDVVVLANLRRVKDPLLAARAASRLPAASRVHVLHLGQILDPALEPDLEEERRTNPRYHFLGPRPHAEALEVLARSRLLVSTSRGEGGANALSEAIACGIPILATRIPGSTGILGPDYPGLYPPGDAVALADLLEQAEGEPTFLEELTERIRHLRPLFDPARERAAWEALLTELRVLPPSPGRHHGVSTPASGG